MAIGVLSSLAIVLLSKRELIALLNCIMVVFVLCLSSWRRGWPSVCDSGQTHLNNFTLRGDFLFLFFLFLILVNVFSEGGRDIAFADYGPTWRVHRKIAAKALR